MKDDGGPAFPLEADFWERPCSGMTMRQYYKAAALSYLSPQAIGVYKQLHGMEGSAQELVAVITAAIADAMIAEDSAHAERDDD